MLQGIDVSHNNGPLNWEALKRYGIQFAFIKATEGVAFTDPKFTLNWMVTEKLNILRGAYHFYRPNSDPYQQARLFLKALDLEKGAGYPSTLPPVLDLEVQGSHPNSVIDGALQWLMIVEKAVRITPIIYLSPSYMDYLGHPNFSSYPLWIAHYGVEDPRVPKPWDKWSFWQYSEKGSVGDIKNLDLDFFNGDYASLKALSEPRSIVQI